MFISKTLNDYLQNASNSINTNIAISNLSKILLIKGSEDFLNFSNKDISNDLLEIINSWKTTNNVDNYLLISDSCKKLIFNDNYSYHGQIILPIFHNNTLDGLLIFFRTKCDFIDSSLKYAKTIQHFSQIFSENNFKDNFYKE